jgi:thiamine biosynthesis protein ThiC
MVSSRIEDVITQPNSSKRGIATEEMKHVAKDENFDIKQINRDILNYCHVVKKTRVYKFGLI